MAKNISVRPRTSPYGSWRSPITSDAIVAGAIDFSRLQLDGDDLYWGEQRPSEGGRTVLVRRGRDGAIEDVTPAGFNVRTRVHEYGGGAFLVHEGTVWFSNFKDQRVYRQNRGAAPTPITPEADIRHADFIYDQGRRRLIAVREDHTTGAAQAVNTI